MRIFMKLWLVLLLTNILDIAWASDACSTRAILTSADVTVSDGTSFGTRSFFHSRDGAAIQHTGELDRVVAVEGPLGWASAGDKASVGSNFYRLFALGHQYHAFILHFDELVTNARASEGLVFQGNMHRARSGDYPYGGTVHLVQGAEGEHPAGLVFEFPERAPINVSFSAWKKLDDVELPFIAEIDDGERIFEYRYTNVEIIPRSPLWFYDSVTAPDLDEVHIYRLHRKLLAAHCLGDAEMIADLSADQIVTANRGELTQTERDTVRERFTSLFERLDYTAYHDIAEPTLGVAESSDLGWIGVNVRAIGSDKSTESSFDNQWAWIMIVAKVKGRWMHLANASNVARQD